MTLNKNKVISCIVFSLMLIVFAQVVYGVDKGNEDDSNGVSQSVSREDIVKKRSQGMSTYQIFLEFVGLPIVSKGESIDMVRSKLLESGAVIKHESDREIAARAVLPSGVEVQFEGVYFFEEGGFIGHPDFDSDDRPITGEPVTNK